MWIAFTTEFKYNVIGAGRTKKSAVETTIRQLLHLYPNWEDEFDEAFEAYVLTVELPVGNVATIGIDTEGVDR